MKNTCKTIRVRSAEDYILNNLSKHLIDPSMMQLLCDVANSYAEYRISKQFSVSSHLSDISNSIINQFQDSKSEKIVEYDSLMRELEYQKIITTNQRELVREYLLKITENNNENERIL